MKKFASILLALTMILAMSIPAFATENTILTINDSVDRTYNGYQLLKLTTSLKCDDATHDHGDTCYNYAYTVNEKYEEILQTLAGEEDIIEYLAGQSGDNADGTYGSLRGVADDIYRAILEDADIDPDADNLTGTDIIEQGYWLFADVTDLSGGDAANSLVILDTKGEDELTLTPTVGLPTL